MENRLRNCILLGVFVLLSSALRAEVFMVSSLSEFEDAQDDASANDSILWESGTFSDIYMIVNKNNLYIGAAVLGETIFDGASRVRVNSDNITFEGFQYIGGDIGDDDIINIYGSHCNFRHLNLTDYTCYKYLRIREQCEYVNVTYCNFENRLNLDDQNILSILVDDTNPGYHKIQYCSFKNFDGSGNDLGIEPIRIGLSTQADHISRSLVEYCYFTKCNGDGELISSKASQNVYRYNTFEDNPLAELVLRHGSENIVYGNFFLNGKGGVRVREGQDHYIYNNYFYDIDDRVIYLQNEDSDPLDNINIAFNTVVNCAEVRLGRDGNDQPTNITFANNIFADPLDQLFEDDTENETWIGNMYFGILGITVPPSGLTRLDPLFHVNTAGFIGLSGTSPAIDAAEAGYAPLPQFPGMDPVDTDISLDLMGQSRPAAISEKDLGSNEFPHNIFIQPIATEGNTGPIYKMDPVNTISVDPSSIESFLAVSPNPASKQLNITIQSIQSSNVKVDMFNIQGQFIDTIFSGEVTNESTTIQHDVSSYPKGTYLLRTTKTASGKKEMTQTLKWIKQ